jgi:hypothetical protein
VFPRISSADEETIGYTHVLSSVKLHALHGSVVPTRVAALLGLCNPPCQGCGESAKPGLLYPLVWIPCFGIVFVGVVQHSMLLNK